MIEIERKFLVKNQDFKAVAFQKEKIFQGYLNSDPERTVRIRIRGEKGFLTIKGRSSENGLSRYEWEQEIPVKEASELKKLCEPGEIEKIRYLVRSGKLVFEVDEFQGENEGLILAEVELENEEAEVEKPSWMGKEVTGDRKYYNSYLNKNPFKNW